MDEVSWFVLILYDGSDKGISAGQQENVVVNMSDALRSVQDSNNQGQV